MFRIAVIGAICALVIGSAIAQPANEQQTSDVLQQQTAASDSGDVSLKSTTVDCAAVSVSQVLTKSQLEDVRSCLETRKLMLESDPLMVLVNLLVAQAGIMLSIFALIFQQQRHREEMKRSVERDRSAQQQEALRRILEGLSSPTSQVRFAAATMGNFLSGTARKIGNSKKLEAPEVDTANLVLGAAVARLCDKGLDRDSNKHLADEIAKFFRELPSRHRATIKMSDFNFQEAYMPRCYWKGVDASNVDFFHANLSESSFRDARLAGSVFFEANLSKAVFVGANLTGAIFQGADLSGANLRGALLTGAVNLHLAKFDANTTWDEKTKWPEGFTPRRAA